jgi:GNAT superfamily N-acetyltransferase
MQLQATSITIDNAVETDIPTLCALLEDLFGIEADFEADTEAQRRGLAMLIAAPDRGMIKVARTAEGKVIGMVSAQLIISTAQGTPAAWLEDMIVHKDYRHAGIGRTLIDAVLQWCKEQGVTRAQILVDIENTPAVGYYQHLGWQPTQLQARRMFI